MLKKENVERLAILISCDNNGQLIGVSQVENNRGFI